MCLTAACNRHSAAGYCIPIALLAVADPAQLPPLAENMRREGFELSVSPPRVVYRTEGGQRLEPLEEVIAEVDDDQAGAVIEARAPQP